MMARKKVTPATEGDVLVSSKRRCALCFGINEDDSEKRGQIAHVDKDSSNSTSENLVFLCFDHHDAYDSTTRQSKNYTSKEVQYYRNQLYMHLKKDGSKENSSKTRLVEIERLDKSEGKDKGDGLECSNQIMGIKAYVNRDTTDVPVKENGNITNSDDSESTEKLIEEILETKHSEVIKKCNSLKATVSNKEWDILKTVMEIRVFEDSDVTLSKLLLKSGRTEESIYDELKNLASRLEYIESEDNEISLIKEAKNLYSLGNIILDAIDEYSSDQSPNSVFEALF